MPWSGNDRSVPALHASQAMRATHAVAVVGDSRRWLDVLGVLRKVENQMTTKTLGQVLYEADISAERHIAFQFSALHTPDQAEYERMAQSVAAVVREQCAQEAREHHRRMRDAAALRPLHVSEWDASAAIRSMKP